MELYIGMLMLYLYYYVLVQIRSFPNFNEKDAQKKVAD